MKAHGFAFMTVLLASPAMAQPAPPPAGQTTKSGPASACTPTPGEGAQWIARCEVAFKAGDGRAALTLGKIYWNGDGVPKDNALAARWWKMADQVGRPEAAKLLGDEAYVRSMQATGACPVDPLAIGEGITWYQKAVNFEPNPALRQEAQVRLDQFLKLKRLLPPACNS